MTLEEFLVWDAPGDERWQLVDGEPVGMAPTSRTHGELQMRIGRLVGNHLDVPGSRCSIISAPGIIPRVGARANFRIPDLAVTCTPYVIEEYGVRNPILIVEILSPSNRAETWRNVWTFTTIPSVREILLLDSLAIRAELLRRDADGTWPETSEAIEGGDLRLESIDFTVPLAEIYRTTRLANG
jgi:Uma2 family endonuclease